MNKTFLIIIAVVFLVSCKQGNAYEEVLEDKVWKTRKGETALTYFQSEDKKVYMWNYRIASHLKNDPNFSIKDFWKPIGTPKTNKFNNNENKDIKIGWEEIGSYSIANDTMYMNVVDDNYDEQMKFYIAKAYDTLIKGGNYKAIRMYRQEGIRATPVTFVEYNKVD